MLFVVQHCSVHRIPRQRIVTIAKRSGTGRREGIKMICPTGRVEYFRTVEWTVESTLIGLTKLVFGANLRKLGVMDFCYSIGLPLNPPERHDDFKSAILARRLPTDQVRT
jgi:hypothetical protein